MLLLNPSEKRSTRHSRPDTGAMPRVQDAGLRGRLWLLYARSPGRLASAGFDRDFHPRHPFAVGIVGAAHGGEEDVAELLRDRRFAGGADLASVDRVDPGHLDAGAAEERLFG